MLDPQGGGGISLFFPQGEGRGVFRGWAEGWLRWVAPWLAHPFGGVECRSDLSPTFAPSALDLLPALQKWQ